MQEALRRQQVAMAAIAEATSQRLLMTEGATRQVVNTQDQWRQSVEGDLNRFAIRVQEAARETVQQEAGQAQARLLALEAENQHVLQQVQAFRAHAEELERREAANREAQEQRNREAASVMAALQGLVTQVNGIQEAMSQRLAAADASGVQRLQGVETALHAQVQGVTQLATMIAALDARLKVVETRAASRSEALLPFGTVTTVPTSADNGVSESRSDSLTHEQARREPPTRGAESSPATSSSGPPRVENPVGDVEPSRTP
jgi:chromosome segregation ATPase